MTDHTSDCPGRDSIALLAYGELSDEERREALVHVEECAACRSRFADAATVQTAYARIPPPRLDPEDGKRLVAKVTNGVPGIAWRPAGIPWRPLAAAAAIGLAYLAGRITPSASPDPGTAERFAMIEAELAELRRGRLRMAVEHPSAVVRLQEVHAAGVADDASVTGLLLGVLERDPNPNVRLAALDVLRGGELSEAETQIVLSRLLSEPSPVLRSALIDFVSTREIEGSRTLLERLERFDDDPMVRAKARSVLERAT